VLISVSDISSPEIANDKAELTAPVLADTACITGLMQCFRHGRQLRKSDKAAEKW
jgi:hypothetical protein